MKRSTTVLRSTMRNRRLFRQVLLSCAMGVASCYCPSVFAQTWNNPGSGDWHDGGNWSGGVVPEGTDANVVVDATYPPESQTVSPYEVRLESSATIGSLLLNSPDAAVVHSSGTLTVANGINLSQGSYLLSGGTIVGGTLRTNGNLHLNAAGPEDEYGNILSGTLSGVHVLDDLVIMPEWRGNTLILNDGTVLDGNVTLGMGSKLLVDQDMVLQAGQVFNSITNANAVTQSNILSIGAESTLTIGANAVITGNALSITGGSLINYGLISGAGSERSISFSISNDSAINYGTIQAIEGSTVSLLSGSLQNYGLVRAGEGSTLTIGVSSFQNMADGRVVASDGGRVVLNFRAGDSLSNQGAVRVADEASAIALSGTFNTSALQGIENENGGAIEIAGTWNNHQEYVFNQGRIVLNGNNATIVGGSLLPGTNGDLLEIFRGSLNGVEVNVDLSVTSGGYGSLINGTTVAGNISVADGGTLYLGQDFTTVAGQSIEIAGSEDRSAKLSMGRSNVLNISEDSKLTLANSKIETFSYLEPGVIVNEGTIELRGRNSTDPLAIVNRGSIEFAGANAEFVQGYNGSFVNESNGVVHIADGASMTMNNLTNHGSIALQGPSSNLHIYGVASESLAGIDNTEGGTISIGGRWNNQSNYTFNSTTGSIHLGNYANYGQIIGGTLTPGPNGEFLIVDNGSLVGVTVNGSLNVPATSSMVLSGGTQINGNIGVGSSLHLLQDLTIRDGQTLLLQGTGGSGVYTQGSYSLSFDAGSILSGNGMIYTPSGIVHIDGTVSPGFSPGHIEFQSSVIFGPTSQLEIELAGSSLFDTLTVRGDAVLGGGLNVSLLNGFALAPNQSFLFMTIDGTTSGMFDGLMENSLVGVFGGTDLFISYMAGDGNDVGLYTTISAVPEPGSITLLAASGVAFAGWRHRNRFAKRRELDTEAI